MNLPGHPADTILTYRPIAVAALLAGVLAGCFGPEPLSLLHQLASRTDSVQVVVTPLRTINTEYHEYAPAVAADGLTLYFVSNRPGGRGGHDLWIARKNFRYGVDYSEPRPLPPPINSEKNEGAIAIASDNVIYLAACTRDDGQGDCDIYRVEKTESGWGAPTPLHVLNSPHWESQPNISPDGRELYFVSNRPVGTETKADVDIFVSRLNDQGNWGPPERLGSYVNTKAQEASPFVSADGSLLFFASNRPGGIGDYDIYVSRRRKDGGWDIPMLLGEPVNSPAAERFIGSTREGDILYIGSERMLKEAEPSHPGIDNAVNGDEVGIATIQPPETQHDHLDLFMIRKADTAHP